MLNDYNVYTARIAGEIREEYTPGTLEHALADLYAGSTLDGEDIFIKLQSEPLKNTQLGRTYREVVDYYLGVKEFHLAVFSGVWIPTGGIRKLGVHPEIGFQGGVKSKRMNYDLTVAIKFLNSPNYYRAYRKDVGLYEDTRRFFGGYMGADVGYDFLRGKSSEFQLLGGIAFDGFDILEEDKKSGAKIAGAQSYNFNVGLGYRCYVSKESYFGIRVKYHVVDYSLSRTIDFTGNPITVHLVWGWFEKSNKIHSLETLKYPSRW